MRNSINVQQDVPQFLKLAAVKPNSQNKAESLMQILEDAGVLVKSKRILVRVGQRVKLIDMKDVALFYSKNKITFAVFPDTKQYPLDQSLDQVELMIDPHHFFRINRQVIVKMESISEMFAYSRSRMKLMLQINTEADLIVSKERSPLFKKWLLES